jgi:UDP-glucuronate decarboxylase
MNKIWVTGSRGFIGKELVSLLKQNNEIKCLTHNINKNILLNSNPIEINFLNENNIKKLVEKLGVPDIFIHLGWASMSDPESEEHLTFNINSSKNLIKNLFEFGLKKFIFLGSRDEYGEKNGSLSENMNPEGRVTKYAQAKSFVANYGFEEAKKMEKIFIHIRLFNAYGHGQKKNSLINTLYENKSNQKLIHLGPCKHFREYIHISEVVKGINLLSCVEQSDTINLGSGKTIQLKEFVELFWKELGCIKERIIFEEEQVRKNDPVYPESYANLKKLNELTRWNPSLSIKDGIKKTIEKLSEI